MTHASGSGEKRHDTLRVVTGKSGRGTARQTIRVDEELWKAFGESCKALGIDRSIAIRDFIRWHTWQPRASRPTRPPASSLAAGDTEAQS